MTKQSNPFSNKNSKDSASIINILILLIVFLFLSWLALLIYPGTASHPIFKKQRYQLYSLYNQMAQKLGLKSAPKRTQNSNESNLPFEEGKHYERVSAKITSNPAIQEYMKKMNGKVQLIEFFSYACYGCWHINPMMEEWLEKKKPKDLSFSRVPVVFQKNWEVLAKVFYVISELKRPDIAKEMFVGVQQKHLNLADEKILKEFFAQHGVPESTFSELYNSFAVNRSLTEAKQISDTFQIVISPSYILNLPSGTYHLTTTKVGSEKGLFDLIEYLIAQENM